MATITSGAATISPTALTVYESQQETRSIVHTILSRPDPDITLRVAGLRRGSIELTFADVLAEATSEAARVTLAGSGICALSAPDRPTIQMQFVLPEGGRIQRRQGKTGASWIVTLDYQEVAP